MWVRCFIHNELFTKASCNLHHEAPQAAGGGDEVENLVWLCASCHTLAHRVAQLFETRKAGEAKHLCEAAFPAPAHRARLEQVVKEMLEAHAKAKSEGIVREITTVEIKLPAEVHSRLKLAAKQHKSPMNRYVKTLIMDDLRKKGLI